MLALHGRPRHAADPVLVAGLICMFAGHPELEPVMVVGSLGVLVSLLLFVVNLFLYTRRN